MPAFSIENIENCIQVLEYIENHPTNISVTKLPVEAFVGLREIVDDLSEDQLRQYKANMLQKQQHNVGRRRTARAQSQETNLYDPQWVVEPNLFRTHLGRAIKYHKGLQDRNNRQLAGEDGVKAAEAATAAGAAKAQETPAQNQQLEVARAAIKAEQQLQRYQQTQAEARRKQWKTPMDYVTLRVEAGEKGYQQTDPGLSPLQSNSPTRKTIKFGRVVPCKDKSLQQETSDYIGRRRSHSLPPVEQRIYTLSPTPAPRGRTPLPISVQIPPQQSQTSQPQTPRKGMKSPANPWSSASSSPLIDRPIDEEGQDTMEDTPPNLPQERAARRQRERDRAREQLDRDMRIADLVAALDYSGRYGFVGETVGTFKETLNKIGDSFQRFAEVTSAMPKSEFRKQSAHGWKIQKLGYFNPDLDESYGEKTTIGNDTTYRNVHMFADAVKAAAKNPAKKEIIKANLPDQFKGEAELWFFTLSDEKKNLLSQSLTGFLNLLVDRYKMKPAEAYLWLADPANHYTREKLLAHEDFRTWSLKLMNVCKAVNITDSTGLMTNIYNRLYPGLKVHIPEDAEGLEVDDYLDYIERKVRSHRDELVYSGHKDKKPTISQMVVRGQLPMAPALIDAAKPQRMLQAANATYHLNNDENITIGDDEHANYFNPNRRNWRGNDNYGPSDRFKGHAEPRHNRDERGDRRPFYRRSNRRFGFRRRGRGDFRNRRQGRNRRFRKYHRTARYEGRAYIAEENHYLDPNDSEFDEQEQTLNKEGFIYVGEEEDDGRFVGCENDSSSINSDIDHSDDGYEGHAEEAPSQPQNRKDNESDETHKFACSKCAKPFPTEQAWFVHELSNTCESTQHNEPKKQSAQIHVAYKIPESGEIIMKAKPKKIEKIDKGIASITYCQVNIEYEGHEPTTGCLDTGATNTLADRKWVQTYAPEAEILTNDTLRIRGIGGTLTLTERAILTFVLRGNKRGKPTHCLITAEVWIMDNLKPDILLGSSFLAEHGVTIDYGRNKATFSSCNGMETDITVYRKRNTIRRRVLVEAATVVPANSRTLIHVCYADVDEFDDYGSRRDYQFIASAKGFSNCVTDARSAKVVPYTNLSDKAIRLTRKQKVGHLTDIGEDGFIATSWERANMVQTACIIQDEQRTEEMSNKPAPTDNDEDNDVWISQEFTLTDDMMAMLQSEDCTPDDL
ncbi:uncharacterized protein BCR38DRAFT_101717 [Pseudomassariella vexata]|uniref:Peptidase A2 domain-containing protein n=1 Tax=Pseudomassariella vexata TaxID=1141098 RepID=A0A1Y2EF42_9PEZI|nr:uncharacterized protein BCR38DRAFT_101717 [Pseudomassariella vexata]ORY70191.1 hypothetical protein BCR38DRAFT_101717 [Pseudomassariella vexata]